MILVIFRYLVLGPGYCLMVLLEGERPWERGCWARGLIKTGPSFPSSDLGQNGVQKAGTTVVLEQIYFLENRVDFVFVSNRVNKYIIIFAFQDSV